MTKKELNSNKFVSKENELEFKETLCDSCSRERDKIIGCKMYPIKPDKVLLGGKCPFYKKRGGK